MIRYDLEKALFSGALDVTDLPDAWNEACRNYLGDTPQNDREGVLQDIHWSGGAFGYFPSYLVGNLIAAQLWATMQRDIEQLNQQIPLCEYSGILEWLRRNIHRHGQTYEAMRLIQNVTGEALNSDRFIQYLESRYSTIFP